MINLYIAKNNCGKTTLLNEIKGDLEKNKNENCIFFPVGNEILSSINKEDSKSNTIEYENPLHLIINKVIKSREDPKDNQFYELKDKYSKFLKSLFDEYNNLTNEDYKINNKFNERLKNNFNNNELISRINFLPEFKYTKKDLISTGEIQISNIFSTIQWLKLMKNEKKINIFFDEPETYLHPQYINVLCSNLIKLNDEKNIDFYIASHNPQLIKQLINFTSKSKIQVYVRSEPYDDELKQKISDLFIQKQFNENEYISANKILCEIFNIYTIEYFDEILEEFKESDEIYKMCAGHSDKRYCEDNEDKIKGYCFDVGNEFKSDKQERDGNIIKDYYFHKTYMSFVRNFFHHPSAEFRSFVKSNNYKIDELLEKSIKWLLNVKNSN